MSPSHARAAVSILSLTAPRNCVQDCESWPSCCLRHCSTRPSPGCTPGQCFLTSSPHARTNASSPARACLQAGENLDSFCLKHPLRAPPPGFTPGQYFSKSALQGSEPPCAYAPTATSASSVPTRKLVVFMFYLLRI